MSNADSKYTIKMLSCLTCVLVFLFLNKCINFKCYIPSESEFSQILSVQNACVECSTYFYVEGKFLKECVYRQAPTA